jgi:hypothetical protein
MLKSKSMNDRWIEVKKLVKWIIKKNWLIFINFGYLVIQVISCDKR